MVQIKLFFFVQFIMIRECKLCVGNVKQSVSGVKSWVICSSSLNVYCDGQITSWHYSFHRESIKHNSSPVWQQWLWNCVGTVGYSALGWHNAHTTIHPAQRYPGLWRMTLTLLVSAKSASGSHPMGVSHHLGKEKVLASQCSYCSMSSDILAWLTDQLMEGLIPVKLC